MRQRTWVGLAAMALVLAACASGDGSMRTVEVRMSDDMRFDPGAYTFSVGDTVRFEVVNDGQIRHEFVIGTEGEHHDHAEAMHADEHGEGDMHDDGDEHGDGPHGGGMAALSLDAGESGALEYTFDEAGELMVGCHEPGHFEAGMVAPITVEP